MLFYCQNSRLGRNFGCLTVGLSSELLACCRISIKVPSMENSSSRVLTADMLTLAASAAALFSESVFGCPGFNSFVLVFLCSPQSRSSRTSVKSTAGSRGDGSWKWPSTRLRLAAPVMPPAPVPPSTLPAPHQVGKSLS